MQLHYKQQGEGHPLIILHGLMGSLDNWQTIARTLSTSYTVYTLDLRNHGRSPHSDEMDYNLMTADLLEFMDLFGIHNAHLMGHSMGGKVAMHFAIQYAGRIDKLIVVDIAPVEYDDRHAAVFAALFAVPLDTILNRAEAEVIMRQHLRDDSTVQFLMKSLYRLEDNHFAWRFNLPVLYLAYRNISIGMDGTTTYPGETLFIKGALSDYITASNYSHIMDMFPHNSLVEIPHAGHWVHADQPTLFTTAVMDYLR